MKNFQGKPVFFKNPQPKLKMDLTLRELRRIKRLESGLETEVWLVEYEGKFYVLKRPITMRGNQDNIREYRIKEDILGIDGIAPIVDHFWEGNNKVLLYDYYPKGDLLQVLNEGTPLDMKEFARSILGTLARLHAKGIGHRDIKPENIVFDDKFNPYLIDFGKVTTARYSTEKLGTKEYCPPQVLAGTTYVPTKADIWSFGALMIVAVYRAPSPFSTGAADVIDFKTIWQKMAEMSLMVVDDVTRDFLEQTLQPESERPTAAELLMHPWLE